MYMCKLAIIKICGSMFTYTKDFREGMKTLPLPCCPGPEAVPGRGPQNAGHNQGRVSMRS